MRNLGGALPQPGGPPTTSQFPSDSVLGRLARGNVKPTEADLEELRKLAKDGNRAERRAAAKHLKKQGIAAPAAAPRAPVVLAAEASTPGKDESVKPPARKQDQAIPKRAERKVPARQVQASKQSAPAKAARRKTDEKQAAPRKSWFGKTSAEKAAPKKESAKQAPRKQSAPSKAAKAKSNEKQAAPRKSWFKKTSAAKAPAKKAPAKKSRGK